MRKQIELVVEKTQPDQALYAWSPPGRWCTGKLARAPLADGC
ncbi:MAG: hypothetical protein ABIH03_16060 [Pseudomonadota bacterium]